MTGKDHGTYKPTVSFHINRCGHFSR